MDYIKIFSHDAYRNFMTTPLQDTMKKNSLTFLLIAARIGVQHRFSINKKIFSLCMLFLALLIGAGSIGAWKAGENLKLTQKKHLLETEHRQMQTSIEHWQMQPYF